MEKKSIVSMPMLEKLYMNIDPPTISRAIAPIHNINHDP